MYFHLRLYEHSKLPRCWIREWVAEKLEMVGLLGISDRYPAELPGGCASESALHAILANPENPTDTPEVLLYQDKVVGGKEG